MLQKSILGKVISRLEHLANEVLEAEIGHSESWPAIRELEFSDKFEDKVELWRRVEAEVRRALSSLNIDPQSFEYDLTDTLAATVCLVELWRLFQIAERDADYYGGGDGGWFWIIEKGLPDIDRYSIAWAHRQAEARKRTATAKLAAKAPRRRRELIEEMIRRFDPGTGTKKSRVATIIKKAEEAKIEGREKLPIRLDKYLP